MMIDMNAKTTESGAICGGQHQGKVWTKKEIIGHTKNPEDIVYCIDCMAGVPFKAKRKGYEWRL